LLAGGLPVLIEEEPLMPSAFAEELSPVVVWALDTAEKANRGTAMPIAAMVFHDFMFRSLKKRQCGSGRPFIASRVPAALDINVLCGAYRVFEIGQVAAQRFHGQQRANERQYGERRHVNAHDPKFAT